MDIVIGIDLARKGKHKAFGLANPGEKIGSWCFDSRREDLEQILTEVQSECDEADTIHVVVEATGWSWLTVAQYFDGQRCRVYRIQAEKAQNFRKYLSKHTKNDRIDAKCLARLWYVEPGYLDEIYLRDQDRFALKRLIKQRENFTADKQRYESRLGALLDGIIPGISGLSNRLVQKKKFRPVLRKLLDLPWVKQMGLSRFRQYIKRRDADLTDADIQTLFDACRDAFELHNEQHVDFDILNQEVNHYLDMVEFAEKKIARLTENLESRYEQTDPEKSLCSIQGVAELSAAYAEAIVGRVERFDNLNKVTGWLGWHPKTEASGKTTKKGLSLSKAGPAQLRKQLYNAANVARQYDPQMARVYYREMVEKGNPHTQAVVACGTRLLHRMIRVMRDRTSYELRDNDGNPIDKKTGRELCQKKWTVPEKVRRRVTQKKAS